MAKLFVQVQRVQSFLNNRGVAAGQPQKDILNAYGDSVGSRTPTNHAVDNWSTFKAFVNKQTGYIKPSKIK